MPDSESRNAERKRKQLYAKLIAFAVIILIAWLKPKLDTLLTGTASQDEAVVESSTADAPILRPNDGISISAADEAGGASETATAVTAAEADPEDGEFGGEIEPPKSSITVARENDTGSSRTKTLTSTQQTKTKPSEQKSTTGSSGKTKDEKSRPLPKLASPPKMSPSTKAADSKTNPNRPQDPSEKAAAKEEPPPGKLTLIRGTRDEFRSTAGLMYVRGSADGHRLKHVLKHAKDDSSKPVHGVYSGDRDQILAWIDIAYVKAKKGGKGTRTEAQGGRTVYTADLGEKIGFVGGQVGKRKGHPPCRFLRLVVQNRNEVVTAYPSQSL